MAELLQVGERFWNYTPYAQLAPYDRKSITAMLADLMRNDMLVVARHDARIIGMIGGVMAPWPFHRDIQMGVELFWYVDPETREAGVGELLLMAMEKQAGLNGVRLWSMGMIHGVGDPAKLLEKHGYKKQETLFMKIL